jgi:hypothetical protein
LLFVSGFVLFVVGFVLGKRRKAAVQSWVCCFCYVVKRTCTDSYGFNLVGFPCVCIHLMAVGTLTLNANAGIIAHVMFTADCIHCGDGGNGWLHVFPETLVIVTGCGCCWPPRLSRSGIVPLRSSLEPRLTPPRWMCGPSAASLQR